MIQTVLVWGLGQIGMGYDFEATPQSIALTHTRAFYEHPAFTLVGGVDKDNKKRDKFSNQYKVPAFEEIAKALQVLCPDVVVIATPTDSHRESIESLLNLHTPKAILCEKPLAYSLKDSEAIVKLCDESGCDLYVNYMRNSEPGAIEVKRRFLDHRIKTPVKGVVWYSKGLFNNGSHFLNLLQNWLGEVNEVRNYKSGRFWNEIDPEPDFNLCFNLGEITFLSCKEENYSHYTIELLAPNGRLRYEQEGALIIWQETVCDPNYAGYTKLESVENLIKTDMSRCMWHVADQLAASLQGKTSQICSGNDALDTIKVLNDISISLM